MIHLTDMAPRYDAPLDTELFKALERVAGRLLPGVPVATPISPGASDRRYYAAAGLIYYGIDPWLVELEESRRSVHGKNERLSLENIKFGVRGCTWRRCWRCKAWGKAVAHHFSLSTMP